MSACQEATPEGMRTDKQRREWRAVRITQLPRKQPSPSTAVQASLDEAPPVVLPAYSGGSESEPNESPSSGSKFDPSNETPVGIDSSSPALEITPSPMQTNIAMATSSRMIFIPSNEHALQAPRMSTSEFMEILNFNRANNIIKQNLRRQMKEQRELKEITNRMQAGDKVWSRLVTWVLNHTWLSHHRPEDYGDNGISESEQLLPEAIHFLCMSCYRAAHTTKRPVEAQLDESVIAASLGLQLSTPRTRSPKKCQRPLVPQKPSPAPRTPTLRATRSSARAAARHTALRDGQPADSSFPSITPSSAPKASSFQIHTPRAATRPSLPLFGQITNLFSSPNSSASQQNTSLSKIADNEITEIADNEITYCPQDLPPQGPSTPEVPPHPENLFSPQNPSPPPAPPAPPVPPPPQVSIPLVPSTRQVSPKPPVPPTPPVPPKPAAPTPPAPAPAAPSPPVPSAPAPSPPPVPSSGARYRIAWICVYDPVTEKSAEDMEVTGGMWSEASVIERYGVKVELT